jgi:uncharacterized integral membrane protein
MARMRRALGWIVLSVHTLVKVITLILAKNLKDIFLVYLFFTIEFKNIAPIGGGNKLFLSSVVYSD